MEGEEIWAHQALNILSSACVREIHHTHRTTKSQHRTRPGRVSNTPSLFCPDIAPTILTPTSEGTEGGYSKNIPTIRYIGVPYSVYPPRPEQELALKSGVKEEQLSSSRGVLLSFSTPKANDLD